MGLLSGFRQKLPKYVNVDGVVYTLWDEYEDSEEAEEEGKKLYRKGDIEEFQILFDRDRDRKGETVPVYGLYVR